jgi:periplasmic protein TonB
MSLFYGKFLYFAPMKIILILCLNMLSISVFCQDKNAFYAMDANMNQTTLEKSKYMLWIHEKEDSNWQWDYYYTWGPLVKSQSFADHDGTVLNGRSCHYNTMGNLDSTGIFDHGKKNGSFFKYTTFSKDSFRIVKQYDYKDDSLVKVIDVKAGKDEKTDTLHERESEYPGGIRQWYRFLGQNLKYPDRAVGKEIQGQVQILFIVDTGGVVQDPYIQKSLEYSLDQEALRVIRVSGIWDPATKDGEKIKSYKMQPFNFRLESH